MRWYYIAPGVIAFIAVVGWLYYYYRRRRIARLSQAHNTGVVVTTVTGQPQQPLNYHQPAYFDPTAQSGYNGASAPPYSYPAPGMSNTQADGVPPYPVGVNYPPYGMGMAGGEPGAPGYPQTMMYANQMNPSMQAGFAGAPPPPYVYPTTDGSNTQPMAPYPVDGKAPM